ncbi:hypothetical protein F0562_018877 [Nyssa sinensis]|uniref:Uncharacterized protein n=1 Tax=Nyssa sinensis TaxID=561372 RepID=A0A5J4ZCP8_9ASTE|nr:hypothetical protein F0562_018877 [Nyssa sinensis]
MNSDMVGGAQNGVIYKYMVCLASHKSSKIVVCLLHRGQKAWRLLEAATLAKTLVTHHDKPCMKSDPVLFQMGMRYP